MKRKIISILIMCGVTSQCIACYPNTTTSSVEQETGQTKKEDTNKFSKSEVTNEENNNVIFDAKKLYKATKHDVDSLLGIVGSQDENEPYVYNYNNETDAVFDDKGYCLNLYLNVESNNYENCSEEEVLKKYGIDVKGSTHTVRGNNYLSAYSNIKGFDSIFEITIFYNNIDNSDVMGTIVFYPEGNKKLADFLENKSMERYKKETQSNLKTNYSYSNNNEYMEGTYFNHTSRGDLVLKCELADIPKSHIQDAINEMYALKGYKFKEEPYKSRYAKYNGWIDNMDDICFSNKEKSILDKLSARR